MSSSDHYLGNPLLKKANTSIEFTQEQFLEVAKCQDDPLYFTRNYIKIVTLDHGLQPIKMYPFQEKMIKRFHENRFNVCKLPRQSGKSTIVVSYLLYYAIFNPNVNIAILANKASTAKDLLDRLQTAYENLPKWMQQGVLIWNKASLELASSKDALFHINTPCCIHLGRFSYAVCSLSNKSFAVEALLAKIAIFTFGLKIA